MDALTQFVGTWRAEKGAPFSTHTFTWERTSAGLRGRWLIEPAEVPLTRAAVAGTPARFEMLVSDPTLEDGCLLFHVNNGPYLTEFRLVSPNDAVVGAALNKLPPELMGPDGRRSIEGHRVQLTRRSASATP